MTEEHKQYLDELRESGVTNMWGAPEFVERRFGVSWAEAKAIVGEWMQSKREGK